MTIDVHVQFGLLLIAVFFSLLPLAWSWRFNRYIRSRGRDALPGQTVWPNVAVILPMRGADPSVERCLSGLLYQDYPSYSVHVIVDSVDDPAWEFVDIARSLEGISAAAFHVELLTDIGAHCSLKLSAQRQAISRLTADTEVVALIDADSIPASDWLRCMVTPLADPNVGVASGIRWFAPVDKKFGTWVRHLNNSACFMNMYVFQIPWGGSLAMRREVIERAGLLDHWSTCFCEDVSLHGPITELGLQIAFVPAATQFNSETTDLRGACRFILRQFVCARLHHANWPNILTSNLLNFAALLFFVCASVIAATTGQWTAAVGTGLIPSTFFTGMFAGLRAAESSLRRNAKNAPVVPSGWEALAALIPTLIISMAALAAAPFIRHINWRGVTYDFAAGGKVHLRKYLPYRELQRAEKRSLI